MKSSIDGYFIEGSPYFEKKPLLPIIIASFKNSWGEIDSLLSILHTIKYQSSDYYIVTIIESPAMMLPDKLVPILFSKLREISDVFIYPTSVVGVEQNEAECQGGRRLEVKGYIKYYVNSVRKVIRENFKKLKYGWSVYLIIQERLTFIKWSYFFKYLIDINKVAIILEDRTVETKLQMVLRRKCKNASLILFPHATMLYIKERISENYKVHKRAEALLVYSELGSEWAKNNYPNVSKIHVVGFPRYDQWWIEELTKQENLLKYSEYTSILKYDKVFAFFTHGITPGWIDYDDMQYTVNSLADIVYSYDDSCLLIKPHPRQDVEELKVFLKKYPSNRWFITNMQALQVSFISTIVVSLLSSTILDALAVKKPVIEFFNYQNFPGALLTEEGRKCSEYGFLNLSIHAQTKEELQNYIKAYFSGNANEIFLKQEITAKKILTLDNASSKRAADIIVNSIKNRLLND